MKSASKIELHYHLNNNSHQINAFLRNKCEAEILAITIEIASILDINADLVAIAAKEGGFREIWSLINGNAPGITALAAILTLTLTAGALLHESESESLEIEYKKLQIEEKKLSIEKLKNEIKNSEINDRTLKEVAKNLSGNMKIIKRKSNFYSNLINYQEIRMIGFSTLDDNFRPSSDEIIINRKNFKDYVLSSNKLRSEEIEAQIEIVSPVLKEGKYKWKGIYNNETIGFEMLDLSFKDMVLLDSIPFQHGSSIICVLRINRELDEAGDIKITGYAVTTVIEKIDGPISTETPQGIKYRHTKKHIDNQGNLFS